MLACCDTVAAAATKSLQSCPTLCDPIEGSPSGSPSLGFSRQEHWSGWPLTSHREGSQKKQNLHCDLIQGYLSHPGPQKMKEISLVKSAAAAAAKSPQLCPTLCDPIDCSPPGSPFLGFSRQEHWSGLPFPSPMHESEK